MSSTNEDDKHNATLAALEEPEGSIGRFGRQRSVAMTEDTENRVLLLAEMNGMTASSVMRHALMIGIEKLDGMGKVTGYRRPERRARAAAIRESLRVSATGGAARKTARREPEAA